MAGQQADLRPEARYAKGTEVLELHGAVPYEAKVSNVKWSTTQGCWLYTLSYRGFNKRYEPFPDASHCRSPHALCMPLTSMLGAQPYSYNKERREDEFYEATPEAKAEAKHIRDGAMAEEKRRKEARKLARKAGKKKRTPNATPTLGHRPNASRRGTASTPQGSPTVTPFTQSATKSGRASATDVVSATDLGKVYARPSRLIDAHIHQHLQNCYHAIMTEHKLHPLPRPKPLAAICADFLARPGNRRPENIKAEETMCTSMQALFNATLGLRLTTTAERVQLKALERLLEFINKNKVEFFPDDLENAAPDYLRLCAFAGM
ncbi:uncharacterized protein MONBRDRAFT_10232 [Monosiga brevicollis MX1]|uniref:MRG domain-containing protein n=1 Tax=Monosiga brevicollis TaxID=81824 RepID=A9V5L5_MONBE|nr:uncharacterized protein MONBRDRAFT_10232 [Monosiga brevicollis MX1]EDQ87140.1 predicted protein [Monosiga brevicollis MX1]|eukprot:XP_001748083.1 hypothetical protein [Monosiga brevicollis MX1]